MKQTKIIYWIITGLFSLFMVFSSVPDLLGQAESIAFITKLGYPTYIIYFLAVAKLLGIIAILIPGFPRLKEWAYAGLAFDLIGALYSLIATGAPVSGWVFMALPILFLAASYIYYHKKEKYMARPAEAIA